nr:NADH dehydrogenase subunit 3, mitochondrial [Tanacetum cinerariifolium]
MVDQDENESGNPGHTHPGAYALLWGEESEEDLSSDHPEHEGATLDVRSAAKERRKGPWGIAQGLKSSIQILSFFGYAASRARSEKTKWAVVMSEFAPICIYLVISPLVSLIPLSVPFPFASNSSTYPEKLSTYECGFDPFGDARSRFDIRFYLVSILFTIPDPEVTFSFPWAVPPNKIDPFGSWSMMTFLLILKIRSLYEWKRGASDRE